MKLIINQKEYQHFTAASINLKYAAVASTFSFSGISDFLPPKLSYPKVEIFDDNDELLITGTVVSTSTPIERSKKAETLSGYSLPGVLEDSSIYDFPLQFDNLSLKEIADKLTKPYNIEVVVNSNVLSAMSSKYKKTSADVGQSPKDYLNTLASQKGINITHDTKGRLVFENVDFSLLRSVVVFTGKAVISMKLDINGQAMHSHIKVMRQASKDNPDAGEAIIENPLIQAYRPKVKVLSSGDIFDTETAARMERAAELQSIKIVIVTTYFVRTGQVITIDNSDIFTEPTEVFVEQVSIKFTNTSTIYSLTCVLRSVYDYDYQLTNIFS